MKLTLLRYVIMIDAAVLILLGACLVCAPKQVELVFRFRDLPDAVSYLLAIWGCVFLTLGFGYVKAATDPLRYLSWIQMGIARGALEVVVGLIYLSRGVVSWSQAGFGVVTAALMMIAYLVLYPKADYRPAAISAKQPSVV